MSSEKIDYVQWDENDSLFSNAIAGNSLEHDLGLFAAIKKYPWAIFWSITMSMTIVMEGYDANLMGNFFAYPQFAKKYGKYYSDLHQYQLSGSWQVALGNGSNIGSIIGAALNGFLSQRFGARRVILVALAFLAAFIFVTFFAPSVAVLFVGNLLSGITWGIFATIAPAYTSEVCPLAFRGYLTAYINMCFAIGQFISLGVLEGLVGRPDQWSYRIPFAIQWIWPPILIVVLWFAPESPWWLVRKGRIQEAKEVTEYLTSRDEQMSKKLVAMMMHTNDLEQSENSNNSYFDCFRGVNLRRTEIACVTFMGNILSGFPFAYSGSYFFVQAGISPDDAYKVSLGGTAIAFVGTIIAWFLMAKFGRRTIYAGGMSLMTILLLTIGCLDFGRKSSPGIKWGQAVLALTWLFVFSASVGTVGWTIPAECGATRLRQQTICLARICFYLANVFGNSLEPYMINPTEWNWNGKTGFFWFGFSLAVTIWTFLRLPETKNRTFAELDILFERKIPAWRFSQATVMLDGHSVQGDVSTQMSKSTS